MIIGITGTDGAGKGAAVRHIIRAHGFKHYSSRKEIEREVIARGLVADRNNLRLVANSLRAEFGNDVLVARSLKRMAEQGNTDAVIESIRTLAESETLRAHGGTLLAIDADIKKRYSRVTGRGSDTDKVTLEEFQQHEALEMNDPDPNGMQKAKVMAAADVTIQNNGSLNDLYGQIDDFLNQYVNEV